MKILLVNMPWFSIDSPSLALGILLRTVATQVPDAEVSVLHANLEYVDWITARCSFGAGDYRYYSDDSYFLGCGDWVFSSALYDDPAWRVQEFQDYMAGRMPAARVAKSIALHELAPAFIGELAGRIAELDPDVVGFTTTFQQNTAALAAARAIKRLRPDMVTVLGGANCDGDQGAALHRNFGFIDFVVRGEGEVAFPRALLESRAQGEFSAIPGLCWRQAGGASVINPMGPPLGPAEIGTPDFGDYFDRVSRSAARSWSEPRLVLESARGCWWGEKHHCTFCGLNGSSMRFRSKPAGTFIAELLEMVARYRVLDISVVDNILDMDYLTSALPKIAQAGYDLRIHYEIKANMRRDQLRTLLAAGVVHVQPGIENLSSKVLKLMAKGVTGCQNVRLLRDTESLGMQAEWNYLCGFPGEEEGDYDPVVAQFPVLHHLRPPSSSGRIVIERFSPYYRQPELGFDGIRPAGHYAITYDLRDVELADLAYLFAGPQRGISDAAVSRVSAAVDAWRQAYYAGSRLTYCDLEDEIILVNTRPQFPWHTCSLTDPAEIAAFRLLDQPHSASALTRKLGWPDNGGSPAVDLLGRWQVQGIVFAENGQFIQVATAATNQELQRLDADRLAA